MKNNKLHVIKAGSSVLIGYGLSQVIRLASNIILTRLLVPEYFGILSIANVFIMGIYFFSDVGIEPAVIRSKHVEKSEFLNTAWTLQIIRGCFIFLISLAMAYPASHYYKEDILLKIIPIIGLLAIVQGFNSTNFFLFSRELKQTVLNLLNLGIQIISQGVVIIIAYFYRSIWALVAGLILTSMLKLIVGHFLDIGNRPRLILKKEHRDEILNFGKWIFFSSAVTFLSNQVDKLLLGKLLTFTLLGIYNIALIFAELPKQVLLQITSKIMYPIVSRFIENERNELRDKIAKVRFKMLLLLAFCVSILCCYGDYLIIFLYDERYHQAAWMLPVLAIGMWPFILHVTINNVLFAIGKPKYVAFGDTSKFFYMLLLLPLIYNQFGLFGAIIVIAFNDLTVYIIVNLGLWKEKLSLIKQDLLATGGLVLFVSMQIIIRLFLGLGLPGVSSYIG